MKIFLVLLVCVSVSKVGIAQQKKTGKKTQVKTEVKKEEIKTEEAKPSYDETVNWINSKVTSYLNVLWYPFGWNNVRSLTKEESPKSDGLYTYSPSIYDFNFEIRNCKIIISLITPDVTYSPNIHVYHYYIMMPVADIYFSDFAGDGKDFAFRSKIKAIKITETCMAKADLSESKYLQPCNSSDSHTWFTDQFFFPLDFEREDNLYKRFVKAIETLKTYCPKAKSNEAF